VFEYNDSGDTETSGLSYWGIEQRVSVATSHEFVWLINIHILNILYSYTIP